VASLGSFARAYSGKLSRTIDADWHITSALLEGKKMRCALDAGLQKEIEYTFSGKANGINEVD
jgi:hypothetical protein